MFDVRLTPKSSIEDFEKKLNDWIKIAESSDPISKGSITYKIEKMRIFSMTSINENENYWWKCFVSSCKELNLKTSTEIFPGATDSRFMRELGIPAFGFSPMNNTPILMHDHNEYLNEEVFLKGIDILYKIVLDVANLN